jgi:predicted anti-sigma-YlaC factor YlaD
MTGHERMEELIAAYGLDALDADERRRAQAELIGHIASCEPCRALFRDTSGVAADLALAIAPVPAPGTSKRG